MSYPSPLLSLIESHDAQLMSFGQDIAIAAVHESVEVEYAALRKSAAIMDCPHRALLELRGSDRTLFLHRLLSGDIRAMQPGSTQRMFLLTAQGRIMADLWIKQEPGRTLIETWTVDGASLATELDKMLFGEDVRISDRTQSRHCLAFLGPKAKDVIASLGLNDAIQIDCGTVGQSVWVERDAASGLWEKAMASDVMPLGWLAFNMARIEAGTPLFHVDFGPDSLPHETSIVADACSFTKGCYRGQEIVARMQSLGHPSKLLVGFISETDALPVAGEQVLDKQRDGQVVGAVTSSTLSPMRSARPVGFAMLKWGLHQPDTRLYVPAEGSTVAVQVRPLKLV